MDPKIVKQGTKTYFKILKVIEEELFTSDHALAKHLLKNLIFNVNYRTILKKSFKHLPLKTIMLLQWLHLQFSELAASHISRELHKKVSKL